MLYLTSASYFSFIHLLLHSAQDSRGRVPTTVQRMTAFFQYAIYPSTPTLYVAFISHKMNHLPLRACSGDTATTARYS